MPLDHKFWLTDPKGELQVPVSQVSVLGRWTKSNFVFKFYTPETKVQTVLWYTRETLGRFTDSGLLLEQQPRPEHTVWLGKITRK